MECKAQSYWYGEYQHFKRHVTDSQAHKAYRDFAKRQYHRARRQHDKKIIENQLAAMG